jgi:hypothetical protein
MTQYRIHYWEGRQQYILVVGTTDISSLASWYKNNFNRVKIEEIK